jgi:hypothetical protein
MILTEEQKGSAERKAQSAEPDPALSSEPCALRPSEASPRPSEASPRRPWGKRQAPRPRMEGNLLPTNLTLTREHIEWLDARAEREGRSRSDVARAVLSQAIRKDRAREERRTKKETP